MSTYAILDFTGDALDPDKLAQVLTTKPTLSKRKGDRVGSSPQFGTAFARTGYCGFSTRESVHSDDMADHVRFLLDEIVKHRPAIDSIMAEDKLAWEITCFFDSPEKTDADLDGDTLKRARATGIRIITESWGTP
ncbi:MAG: DUF4279 domain-containing protein [Acetobacteraceae bacterium]